MEHNLSEKPFDLSGLVYGESRFVGRHGEKRSGEERYVGILKHTDLKSKPVTIKIHKEPIGGLEWVPEEGLYYSEGNVIRKLCDRDGNGSELTPIWSSKREGIILRTRWVPGIGICDAGENKKVSIPTDGNSLVEKVIVERPGAITSLTWVPGMGLLDAGILFNEESTHDYSIMKCLDDKGRNVDKLVVTRDISLEKYGTVPQIYCDSEIGLLDNGHFYHNHNKGNVSIARYLNEKWEKCNEVLTQDGFVDYDEWKKLGNYGPCLVETGGISSWARVPNYGLLYADRYGIHRLFDENWRLIEDDKNLVVSSGLDYWVEAMTWVGLTK